MRSKDNDDSAAFEQIQNLIDDGNESSSNIETKRVDIVVGNPWAKLTASGYDGEIRYFKLYDGSVEFQFRNFRPAGKATSGGAVWVGPGVVTLPAECCPSMEISTTCYDSQFLTTRGYCGVFNISTTGFVTFYGQGWLTGLVRFMPSSNAPSPLACFPLNVKTRFKASPKAVVAIRASKEDKDSKKASCAPLAPFWRFINTTEGPTVQIINIQGLEYDSKQKIDLVIIGDL
jgi:hypothetical protein